MKLQTKLLTSKLVLTVIPAATIAGIILWKTNDAFHTINQATAAGFQQSYQSAFDALLEGSMTDLKHVAENVHAMCQAQQELLEQKLGGDLNVADNVLRTAGPVTFAADDSVNWEAANQYTNSVATISLPKMLVGGEWLGQFKDASNSAPIVDVVKQLVGGTCTIFQRMNEAGDMLRVCTNVMKLDGTRAIGTYIPAVNPDGKPNPVIAAVLKGETFRGRAFVVNDWYVTAYKPLFDEANQVVGVLYVGVKEQSAESLRKAVMSIKVGTTGYVYVLNSAGHYVISAAGEDISASKDANGKLFIQEICEKAKQLKAGEVADARYAWQNQGEDKPRDKVVKVAYFAPWDWVIGVGAYEDEFYTAAEQIKVQNDQIQAVSNETQNATIATVYWWCAGTGGVLLLISISLALAVSRSIAKPISRIINNLNDGADQVAEAANQVAGASQNLAQGASEQAASLEETSSSLEEMSTMTRNNAENSRQANDLADQARQNAARGDQTTKQLNEAMISINESADKISKIIKVIEEIAFQTNLLALNAAVEAARAGEHGKGFAVVADEVRNLAQRAAQASGEITGLIEDSVTRARDGANVANDVSKVLSAIGSDVGRVADLLNGISNASQEQAQGIEQVNTAMSEMDKLTQQTAAGAEESASTAEELSSQAQSLRAAVNGLVRLIGDTRENKPVAAEHATPPPSAEKAKF